MGSECKYWGETSRTAYDRGSEHLRAMRNGDKESPMVEHWLKEHGDIIQDLEARYKMEVVEHQRSPLYRQVREGFLIEEFKGTLMNRRGEWGQNLLPPA